MALWTPANLATLPYAIVDCRNVVWSGSTFSSLANSGTTGGSWVISRATAPIKGTVVNSITPINMDGTQGLKLTSQNTGTTRVTLAVAKLGTSHNCIFSSEWNPPVGFAGYIRRQDTSLPSGSNGDNFYSEGINYYYQEGPGLDILETMSVIQQSGVDTGTRNGAAGTNPGTSGTTTPVALTNKDLYCGDSGVAFGPEGMLGDLFWAAMADGITVGDLTKWQGWASWTIAGDGSLLPVGHAYKSAAPTTDSFAAFSTPQLDGQSIVRMIGY